MVAHPPAGVVERARAGDAEAWRLLYDAYAGRLLVWLHTLGTGDVAAAAEDVAAEVWLTAARRIGSFRGDEQAFAGWLFGIGRHHVANVRRRSRRRATTPSDAPSVDESWGVVDDVALTVVARDDVARLLALLPPREAEVVAAIDVAGLDAATTAAALGISPTAVRVARHRALGRLRTHLADG
ncbi:RNA polymerase sigma factor [Nocardioides iriomotensis]|uniref:RNA polymerase sigma factor n=1 Tax=Nocardioides iriomotensis TaxID=715784 RepID=UPI0013EC7C64|nr:sigma-70 family RNA polymerase sigma factor [Nocardioides iriomotensis]